MSTGIVISLIVVIIAFALFFYLSFKGVNLFLTVFACAAIVSLCTADGITSIFTSFMPAVGNMFQTFFLLYTIGGAFGFCLMESGLGDSMAKQLVHHHMPYDGSRRCILSVRNSCNCAADLKKNQHVKKGGSCSNVRRCRLDCLRNSRRHAERA